MNNSSSAKAVALAGQPQPDFRLSVVCSVYDHVAKQYGPPVTCLNEATARRMFAQGANDPKHFIGQHPGDYTMFVVASFNAETAEVVPLQPHVSLGLASTYVKES